MRILLALTLWLACGAAAWAAPGYRQTAMIRALALTLGLLLACSTQAFASVSLQQAVTCGVPALTLALGSSPTNGHIVTGNATDTSFTLVAGTMLDSNSVSYTNQEAQTAGSIASGAIWDKVVSGSPTATYTFNTASSEVCLYEIAGAAYPGTYTFTNTASSGTTVVATLSGVRNGDLLICGGANANGDSSGLAISNGSNVADHTSAYSPHTHSFATSTASSTCTMTTTAGGGVIVVFQDYTAPSSVSPTPKLFPYPYPNLFQPAYAPQGDPVFEMLVDA